MRTAPFSGSAEKATSGTARVVPLGTPGPTCQDGRLKAELTPPPLAPWVSFQTFSLLGLPLEARVSDVPPTPVTLTSEAGASTCRGPLPECPEESGVAPASPEEAKGVTPAFTRLTKN